MNIPKSSCLFVREIQVYLTNYTTKLWIFQANTKSDPDNRSGCRGRLCYMYFWWNKSRRSLVYHQFRRNCISSTRSVASHQAAGNTAFGWWYAPTAMIYTLTRDDIQPQRGWWYAPHFVRWWYTKPAAWIKNKQLLIDKSCFFFGTPRGIRTPDPLVRSQILYPAELLALMLS